MDNTMEVTIYSITRSERKVGDASSSLNWRGSQEQFWNDTFLNNTSDTSKFLVMFVWFRSSQTFSVTDNTRLFNAFSCWPRRPAARQQVQQQTIEQKADCTALVRLLRTDLIRVQSSLPTTCTTTLLTRHIRPVPADTSASVGCSNHSRPLLFRDERF